MRGSYNNHSIIIRHDFKHGVDFNISCRKWNMLRYKEWIIDNVINIALALLQQRNIVYGKNYWILNTYKMEYLISLKLEKNVIEKSFIKLYLEEIYLNMTSYIIHATLEIYSVHC